MSRGPVVRGPFVRGPVVRGPVVRGPVVWGPVVRGQIGVLSIEGTVVTRHPSSDICIPTLSLL